MCKKCGCVCKGDKLSPHLQVSVVLLRVLCEITCFTQIGFGVCIVDLAFNSIGQFVFVPAELHNLELWFDTF